ncbi:Lycopene beta and epsilon cyclase [Hymenobacter roseosalivarius DSM 11622]|uniref:Lycopene beta and epsilon cyclase n=1 Tax=Hymenobacter roseosalivarius DSM 11622 TaxID=645990 RepID=A0A1W1VK94_9BACT|nr:lycopene cyclase family protein [Hymenobacter roseosalivarius]SMB93736.1 Lycopene beta and epsilon cyclase [Hymenobacter roseosalivarius DSM 11622]
MSVQADFDYLIAGGGAAGLSFAYAVAQEPRLCDKRVLLLEPAAKDQNDRTWSFWADEPLPFDSIVAHEWQQLAFRSPGFEQVFPLSRHRYKMIRGLDFYQFVHAALAANPQFTLVRATVESLENLPPSGVVAHTSAGKFTARYAFDSRPPAMHKRPDKHRYLLQHFVGWEVETEQAVFDPETVEFMDFRGAQYQEPRFMYVLPFSPRRALVEYTLFSGELLPKAAYEAAIHDYLITTLSVRQYRIESEEVGAIPMTDHRLPARRGANIINLGTRAGRAKPSTGYAFNRIQAHTARLVASLAATGAPPADLTGDQWQFRLFDTLLLDIMQRQGETTRDIFTELFQHNPVERIFDFLDERTSWVENFQVMNSVTPWPFLRSIGQVLRGQPGRR